MHYYMVYIAYFTELNLPICDYAQKRRICRENCNCALDERFHGHVCPRRKPAKSCHPSDKISNTYNVTAGTRWQALVFSLCRSTFSSPSPPTSRARGSWCAFRTPSGRSSSSSPVHSMSNSLLLLNPTPGAVDLGGSCARRSCRTTRGVRAASRRGRSGRWRFVVQQFIKTDYNFASL